MKTQVISFNCVLKDPLGRVLSSSFNHDVLARASGAPDKRVLTQAPLPKGGAAVSLQPRFDFHEPIPGLIEGLEGVKEGERRSIFVNAERAYGLYDPQLVMKIPRKKLPHGGDLEIGFQVLTQAHDGECRVFRVTAADELNVTLDGNHPLAGQDLCFDIEAISTREATTEELQQLPAATPTPQLALH